MPIGFKTGFLAVMLGVSFGASSELYAQDVGRRANFEEVREDSLYYQQSSFRPDTRAIIFQKAAARAEQRQARLASMKWYGMSNSRPMAAPTPFTSMYSPTWQMPGGRPFAWYPFNQPNWVYYIR